MAEAGTAAIKGLSGVLCTFSARCRLITYVTQHRNSVHAASGHQWSGVALLPLSTDTWFTCYVQVLQAAIRCEAGIYLTNESVCKAYQAAFMLGNLDAGVYV
jgi:hypothetical protein